MLPKLNIIQVESLFIASNMSKYSSKISKMSVIFQRSLIKIIVSFLSLDIGLVIYHLFSSVEI